MNTSGTSGRPSRASGQGQGAPPGAGGRLLAGRYLLLGELGRGGMGAVWRARDETLRREVAVKEVSVPFGLPEEDVARLHARLEREARAAGRIEHPGVAEVFDVVRQDGRPWIVMELVPGLTLQDVLEAEGPLLPERAASVGAEVLSALRAAHGAGVLHRDVKPANVLLTNDGRVVLTDFGSSLVEGGEELTDAGEVVGSPEYLAPERALEGEPGPASDLWALGVLLFAAVEGRTPFRRETALATLGAAVDDALPAPGRAGPLRPVIEGLLRKHPDDRLGPAEAERLLHRVAGGARTRGDAGAGVPGARGVRRVGAGGEEAESAGRQQGGGPGASERPGPGRAPRSGGAGEPGGRKVPVVALLALVVLVVAGMGYLLGP
ncbi:serine/threonine-protein kinase [Streptomyces sp. NPDC058374]|uniref:serine/threonine-protein kinase n=1 Tax=Streptomyces sp. NPDC058374 TaxID=3346466 RepID=UPI00364891D1